MKENHGYDLFDTLSKAALVVPLVLVALIIMVRWGGWGNRPVTEKPLVSKQASGLSPTPPPLNLTGPFACEASLSIGTVSAIIQDRSIIATVSAAKTASHLLVQGDCIYSWDTAEKTGKKMCGVGYFLTLADSLLSRGLISFDSLLSMSGVSQAPITSEDINKAVRSCKKQGKVPQNMFSVPKGVQFADKK